MALVTVNYDEPGTGTGVAFMSTPDAGPRLQYAICGHPLTVSTRVAYTGAQTDAVIGPSVPSGTRMGVTQIQVTASNANTASPAVLIGFGTSATPTGDGVVWSHPGIPGGGGGSRGSGAGVLGFGASDAELRITCGAPTGGALEVIVSYFLEPTS